MHVYMHVHECVHASGGGRGGARWRLMDFVVSPSLRLGLLETDAEMKHREQKVTGERSQEIYL